MEKIKKQRDRSKKQKKNKSGKPEKYVDIQ